MQEFLALPVVDVDANVVRDRSAAAAESIAIERDQRIYAHVGVSSQLIKHLIATSTMAHHMDATRILLVGSHPRGHIRWFARSSHAWCFLSDALETRSDGSDPSRT